MHRFPQIVLIAFLILLTPFAQQTQAQYRFDSWTTDNGLPQGSVNSILQTRDGYIWLATFGGLVRFDGLRFQVFNTGNTKGLRSGRFMELYEDRAGNLWINTEGQGVTRYKDNVFSTYTTENGLPSNQVWKMYEDSAGNLKAQTSGGLVQWGDGTFQASTPAFGEPLNGPFQLTGSGAVLSDDRGKLGRVEPGRPTVDLDPGYFVNSFYEDRAGRLWIGTREGHLLVYENGKLTDYSQKKDSQRFSNVRFHEDRKGRFWITALGEGLFQLKDGRFTRYTTADGLVNNNVISIYEDREGTLWITTKAGLSRMTERAVTAYSTKDGLAADNAYAIYEDHQGQILIGTWNGPGLTRYSNGVFSDVSQQYGVRDVWVNSLFEDSNGRLWIGAYARQLSYVKDGKVTKFSADQESDPVVHAIIEDRAGSIWFGCNKVLIQYKDGRFTTYKTRDHVRANEVFALYEDRQGQLWIGTEAGLSKYKDGVFTNYTEKDGLAGNIVRTIYEDAEGALWIGMYDSGLYRLKDGRFTHYTTSEGLFDNGVFSIIEDGSGHFWISCNLGIYRVRKTELNDVAEGRTKKITSVSYNRRDGMLNAECNGGGHPSGIRARDGRIWFPTQQGVAVIDPARVPVNTQPPAVLVESVVVDTKPVPIGSGLRLEPGQVNVEINYTGLSFINPELVKFKYKLGGLDEDWVDAGTRRTAYYAHLPPGKYQFTVIAANRDAVWNEQGASIQIVVLPPFWRTWWFIAAATIVLGAVIYIFYRRRIFQLERARRAQEEFSRQLIDSQESERKRIAAELHDSLGQSLLIIKNRAYLGLSQADDPTVGREQLKEISESVSDALREVREISYSLRPAQLERFGLTTTLEEMLEKVATSSDIDFTYQVAPLEGAFSSDAEINFFRIVQESINNILKHSAATEAGVKIERSRESVRLMVQDNGKGFTMAGAGSNGPGPHSFGLIGVAERVRLMGGSHTIHSTPGTGTIVSVTIKIHSNEAEHA